MTEAIAVGLRLAGIFYILASLFGLRAVAMDALMTHALRQLTPGGRETRAETWQRRYLLASALGIGCAAIALTAGLAVAAILFGLNWLLQLGYLLAAPRLVAPADPPEPAARARSWRAFAVYGALTALVAAAARTGILRPAAEEPWVAAAAGGAALALVAYAAWLLRPMRAPDGRAEPEPGDPGASGDAPMDAGPSVQDLACEAGTLRVVLTPSWGAGGLVEATTGEPIESDVAERLLSEEARMLVADWLCLFRDVADASDPRRCRLRAADGLARLEALGRPIHDLLAAEIGAERVRFEPTPRPVLPAETVEGLDVMAEYRCHPIWLNEPDRYGCVEPERLGLSWGLARDFDGWASAYDDSYDPDDPGGPSPWSAEERAAHDLEGRRLAIRLARELAETGRGHVTVSIRLDGTSAPVSAAEPLPDAGPDG